MYIYAATGDPNAQGIGQVVVSGPGTVVVSNSVGSADGSSGGGGWIFSFRVASVLVTDGAQVYGNRAAVDGAVVNGAYIGTFEVADLAAVHSNTAGSRGGVLCLMTQPTQLDSFVVRTGGAVYGNTAGSFGGVVTAGPLREVVLRDGGSVYNNSAGRNGGAFAIDSVATFTLDNLSVLANNSAGSNGAAVQVSNGIANVSISGRSRVYGNNCPDFGGELSCCQLTASYRLKWRFLGVVGLPCGTRPLQVWFTKRVRTGLLIVFGMTLGQTGKPVRLGPGSLILCLLVLALGECSLEARMPRYLYTACPLPLVLQHAFQWHTLPLLQASSTP